MSNKSDESPDTQLSTTAKDALKEIAASSTAILVGPNNCGKSYLLRQLAKDLGPRASYIGPARYQNFDRLSHVAPTRDRKNQKHNQFLQNFFNQKKNLDQSPLNIQQAIAQLSDHKRGRLIDIVEDLLGQRMEIVKTIPDNVMSQRYIAVNGHNISFASSGFRLIVTLITCLMDSDHDTFLIDEPELGVSPDAQATLAEFLLDENNRQQHFPHITTLALATHSSIFLDRTHIRNNYRIHKPDHKIEATQVTTPAELNHIHFSLLGNRLETLYLPNAIVIVEGDSDHRYLTNVLSLEFPGSVFSTINATSDSRIKELLRMTKDLFGDIQKSPYRDRIFVVLDRIHGKDIQDKIQRLGVQPENIIVWEHNGIEYYYPEPVLKQIYGGGGAITINGDIIERNGLKYTKRELAQLVVQHLKAPIEYPSELNEKFLKRLGEAIGVEPKSFAQLAATS